MSKQSQNLPFAFRFGSSFKSEHYIWSEAPLFVSNIPSFLMMNLINKPAILDLACCCFFWLTRERISVSRAPTLMSIRSKSSCILSLLTLISWRVFSYCIWTSGCGGGYAACLFLSPPPFLNMPNIIINIENKNLVFIDLKGENDLIL